MRLAERLERGELDHRHRLALEECGEHEDVVRGGLAEPGRDADVVLGGLGDQDGCFLERGLADDSLTDLEAVGDRTAPLVGVTRDQLELDLIALAAREEESAVVRAYQRRELGHDHPADRLQAPLALHHPGEPRKVRVQPVLLRIAPRRLGEVADHLVDVVLQLRDLALRVDGDRPGEVALRHRGRHPRSRVPESSATRPSSSRCPRSFQTPETPSPRPGRRGGPRCRPPSRPRVTSAAKDGELVDHRVDRVLQLQDLALDVDGDLLREVALRDRRRHLGDVCAPGSSGCLRACLPSR